MQFQYVPYLWLLATSFIILLFLAFFAWRYGKVTGAKAFSLCMLNFAFWVFSNGLEMAATDLPTKLFWANMQYFSYTTMHIFWLYMILQFTGYRQWTGPRRILPLFIIPAMTIILVWTDQYHGLIRYGFTLDYSGDFPVIAKSYGPLYWLHIIYGYSIVLVSIFLVARALFVYRSIYRMQALALLVSPVISFIPSILYVFAWSPVKGHDVTPAILGISGIVAAVGLFRYRLFAIIPVARDVAVDNMNLGLLVVDNRGIIVDASKMAAAQLDRAKHNLIGLKAEEALNHRGLNWNELLKKHTLEHKEYSRETGRELYYEVQLLPVLNKQGAHAGMVVLIRDITEMKYAQLQIIEQNSQLAAAKERERLARDLHDNLGQVLGFINVQAQGINKELRDAGVETVSLKLDRLVEVTQSAHQEVREFIRNTRNPAAADKNFFAVINKNISQFERECGKPVTVEIAAKQEWENLSDSSKVNVRYIVAEALHNIRKHAPDAGRVRISFTGKKGRLEVLVEDDGAGFDTAIIGQDTTGKHGLSIMRERARNMGARLEIESARGKGTSVDLVISGPATGGRK